MPTGSIMTSDIIKVLAPIWQEIPETARQVRNRICAVLDYASRHYALLALVESRSGRVNEILNINDIGLLRLKVLASSAKPAPNEDQIRGAKPRPSKSLKFTVHFGRAATR